MRKLLLTTVGATALAVSANATDFTLSGSATLTINDDGNTSTATEIQIGASRTFDNGMTASITAKTDAAAGGADEISISADAVTITFNDFDQNEKAPGLGAGWGGNDIGTEGITTNGSNDTGAISASFAMGAMNLAVTTNDANDNMYGISTSFDVAGTTVTLGGDMYEDSSVPANNMTAIGASASFGNLGLAVVTDQHDAASASADATNYSVTYAMGDITLGAQGEESQSSIAAAYTITPGMVFEMGNLDNGTATASSATLEITF